MDRQEFHFFTAGRGLLLRREPWLKKQTESRISVHSSDIVKDARVFFKGAQLRRDGCWNAPARFLCYSGRRIFMAEASSELEGPDFEKGCETEKVAEGEMLLGHAFGEPVLVARRGDELFAIGATCTHYGGPLAKGLMVDCTVHCPWHHARFHLRTGEAIAAPALNDVACYKIEERGERFFVTGKIDRKPERRPKSSPAAVVIVGAGAAGGAAAEMLRRQGYDGPLTLIGSDKFLPYDRPNLSKDYLAGSAPEEWIPLRPHEFYREQKIDTLTNTTVTGIDAESKQVTLSDNRSLGYGALLLATGAEPVHLKILGDDLPHVCYLRTLDDSKRIIEKAKNASRVVIIGSSFIGLEVAWSLRERKLEVAVVGKDSLPLAKVLGRDLGNLIRETHEAHGVKFHLGRTPSAIHDRDVQLDDGTKLDCDLVVVGIGVRPNTKLAEQAGIATNNGVLVNEYLETNVPGIFAAGDIARWPDPRAGRIRVEHWVVAQRQGQTAARNILGAREPFVVPPFFWSNHFDLHVHYVGHGSGADHASVSGDLKAKNASVIFRSGDQLTAVASIGRDGENLKAEVALERGEEFRPA
jgi:NADPH-dependent 2,4-dienoyl-CoA reductase/sulfur reductase-like enzyme/nitrite reductase/ring-hydroxylating ferredoxin subunit